MVPTTINGIISVLFLLIPGFVFVTLRERHKPSRKLSVLRETSTVFAATATAYLVPLVLTGIFALLFSDFRANLAVLVSVPGAFVQEHPFRFVAIAVTWVLLASVIAALLAAKWMDKFIPSQGGSAWWKMFMPSEMPPSYYIQVSAIMTDNTALIGRLYSWSRDAEDHPDRELVLQAPIWIQPVGKETLTELDAATMSISARNIKYLSAEYFVED